MLRTIVTLHTQPGGSLAQELDCKSLSVVEGSLATGALSFLSGLAVLRSENTHTHAQTHTRARNTVLSTQVGLVTTVHDSNTREFDILFWPLWVCVQTDTHKGRQAGRQAVQKECSVSLQNGAF